MTRLLPLIDIAGAEFFVDVVAEQLRQKENPKNRIPFEVFDEDEGGYSFVYDTHQLNVADEGADIDNDTRYIRITLPALMELDAEGIAIKYGIPLHVLGLGKMCKGAEEEDDDELDVQY